MKNRILFIILLCLIITSLCLSSACRKAVSRPQACISYLPDTATIGDLMKFNSCTDGASSYVWNYGDGYSGTGRSTTHIYMRHGIFTGDLIVSNAIGERDTATFLMRVSDPPDSGGDWTFKDTAYFTVTRVTSQATLTISGTIDTTTHIASHLALSFFGAVPAAPGTYTIVAGAPASAAEVGIGIDIDGGSRRYTPQVYAPGSTISAVTMPDGKILLAGAQVKMVNVTDNTDSAILGLYIIKP